MLPLETQIQCWDVSQSYIIKEISKDEWNYLLASAKHDPGSEYFMLFNNAADCSD